MTISPVTLTDATGIERFRGTQSPGGGSSPVHLVRVKLSDAQIQALPSTPLQLVAGVAGKMVWPLSTLLICDTTDGAYSNISAGVELGVGYAGGTNPPQFVPGNFLVDDASGAQHSVTDLLTAQAVALGALQAAGGISFGIDGGTGDVNTIQTSTYGFALSTSDGAPYDGLDLQLIASNGDGAWTGGNAANSLIVACTYALVDLA